MEKATVYFTNELTPEAVVKMYRQLGVDLPGKVAVKVHSGEDGNQNYLRPEFMKPVVALFCLPWYTDSYFCRNEVLFSCQEIARWI